MPEPSNLGDAPLAEWWRRRRESSNDTSPLRPLGTRHADGRGHRPKGRRREDHLALHLAVEAAKAGPAVIVDIDPQSSAAQWADSRMAKEPSVVACPPARLAVALQAARTKGASFAFIDSAPAVESAALAAVRAADFCLIVSRPGILDLRSIGVNVEIAKLAGKPVAALINAAPAQGGQAAAAAESVRQVVRRRGLPDRRSPTRRLRPCPGAEQVRAGGGARQQSGDRDRRPAALARHPRPRPGSRRVAGRSDDAAYGLSAHSG